MGRQKLSGPVNYSLPHPNWHISIREYPSGPRKIYMNASGKIAQSIRQTHVFEEGKKSRGIIDDLQSSKSPEIKPTVTMTQISPKLRIMAHMFDILSPKLRAGQVFTRSEAAMMRPELVGPATENLRSASIL